MSPRPLTSAPSETKTREHRPHAPPTEWQCAVAPRGLAATSSSPLSLPCSCVSQTSSLWVQALPTQLKHPPSRQTKNGRPRIWLWPSYYGACIINHMFSSPHSNQVTFGHPCPVHPTPYSRSMFRRDIFITNTSCSISAIESHSRANHRMPFWLCTTLSWNP